MSPFNIDWNEWPSWSEVDKSNAYQKATIGPAYGLREMWNRLTSVKVQRQYLRCLGDIAVVEETPLTSQETVRPENSVPTNLVPDILHSSSRQYLVDILETALSNQPSPELRHIGDVVCSGYPSQLALTPLKDPLLASNRLLASCQQIRGVHYGDLTLNKGQSFSPFRKGEANLQCAGILRSGQPVLWVIVPPRHSDKLESRVKEHLQVQPKCSQFVRHENLVVPPSILTAWGIDFSVLAQFPGEAVRTDYLAYFYLWRSGTGAWEAVNCCEDDWSPPPMYAYCRGGECGPGPYLTAETLSLSPLYLNALSLEPPSQSENDEQARKDHHPSEGTELAGSDHSAQVLARTGSVSSIAISTHDANGSGDLRSPRDSEDRLLASLVNHDWAPMPETIPEITQTQNLVFPDNEQGFEELSEDIFVPPVNTHLIAEGPSIISSPQSVWSDHFISTVHVSQRRLPTLDADTITPALDADSSVSDTYIGSDNNDIDELDQVGRSEQTHPENEGIQLLPTFDADAFAPALDADSSVSDTYIGSDNNDIDEPDLVGRSEQTHPENGGIQSSTLHISQRRLPTLNADAFAPALDAGSSVLDTYIGSDNNNIDESDQVGQSEQNHPENGGIQSAPENATGLEVSSPSLLDHPGRKALPTSSPRPDISVSDKTLRIIPPATPPVTFKSERQDAFLTPPSSSRGIKPQGVEITSEDQEATQEIERLIDFGVRNADYIKWPSDLRRGPENISTPFNRPDTESTLATFRPMKWLSDHAVMETLSCLSSARDGIHIIDSVSFAWAYRNRRPDVISYRGSPSLVLIPVFEDEHWYLVSLDFVQMVITVHDNGMAHPMVESFICSMVSNQWQVVHRKGIRKDGSNCGIVLLWEAEAVLGVGQDRDPNPSFCSLRVRYLRLLIAHIFRHLPPEKLAEAVGSAVVVSPSSPSSTPQTLLSGPGSITPSQAEPLSLRYLAATIGCAAVLRDFYNMVTNFRHALERYDSRIETDLRLFNRGQITESLGSLQKNYFALRISRKYRQLYTAIEEQKVENRLEMRRLRRQQKTVEKGKKTRGASARKRDHRGEEKPPSRGTRGRGVSSHVYDKMVVDWEEPIHDENKLRRDLIEANRRGELLLRYEDVCGPTHPLWMLLPAANMECPVDTTQLVKPWM
ncbi:JmjC domain-containing protein [Cladophialophora immunda]|nr:JmjC domain-containing protein [Cladophialophora immunda]